MGNDRNSIDTTSRFRDNKPSVRPACFHVSARAIIRSFPRSVKQDIGRLIWDLQRGIRLGMPVSRAMPSIMQGVEELRIKDRTGAYRVFYFSRSVRGILIFHAFTKKTQKTPASEIQIARRRLKEMNDELQA